MSISLTAQLQELVRSKVASGAYDSAEQVLEEALELLEERDQLRILRRERLLRELASGVFQADNRQLVASSEVFQGLSKKASSPGE